MIHPNRFINVFLAKIPELHNVVFCDICKRTYVFKNASFLYITKKLRDSGTPRF